MTFGQHKKIRQKRKKLKNFDKLSIEGRAFEFEIKNENKNAAQKLNSF